MRSAGAKYLQEVNKYLACPASLKKPFLQQLKEDVIDYCEVNPSASHAMICGVFGTPANIAEEFLSELSAQAVDCCSKRQKRVLGLTVTVVLAAVLILSILLVRDYQLQQKLLDDDFIGTITYAEGSGAGQTSILKNPASTK